VRSDLVVLAAIFIQPRLRVLARGCLREAVASVKPELLDRTGSFGSVSFRFDGTAAANGFAAAIVRHEGHPIDFHFDAEGNAATSSEGVWWLPAETSTAYLILSNPTENPVSAQLALSDAAGATHRQSLTIKPRQSLRTNIREMVPTPASGTFGGLSLSVKEGSLLATEIVFDEVTGQATMLKLFDREALAEIDQVESRTLRAPMMALTQPDPSLAFPTETVLNPKIFLRNAGTASLEVSPGVNWRNDAKSGTSPLPPIKLLPGQMKLVSLADFQKTGPIPTDATWATVTLGYTGRTGDLVAIATSYDSTSRYGLQTPFSEIMNHLFKGSMWHVDSTHNTLITTGNGGTEPTRAQVTLFYNRGQSRYRVEKLLSPGQQLWLNLGELLRNQVPDSDGKTIPPDTMFGSYELRDLDHTVLGLLYEGKLVVDKTYGHASYGCAHCCGYSSGKLYLTPYGGPPNTDNQDTWQGYNACTSQWEDFDTGFNATSSNTAVATLAGTMNLHTVAVGSATTRATNRVPYGTTGGCPQVNMPGSQSVSVGQTVSLAQTDCNQMGSQLTAGWGNLKDLNECSLPDIAPPLPSGGSCVTNGTANGAPRNCYQVSTKTCSITYCPGTTRTVNAACTQFLDSFPLVQVTVPAGCTQ
jgi:hypothetical protein